MVNQMDAISDIVAIMRDITISIAMIEKRLSAIERKVFAED